VGYSNRLIDVAKLIAKHERFVVTRSVPLLEDLGDLDGKSVLVAWISTSRSPRHQRATV